LEVIFPSLTNCHTNGVLTFVKREAQSGMLFEPPQLITTLFNLYFSSSTLTDMEKTEQFDGEVDAL